MSQRFSNLQFQVLCNPFGIQYNIGSISTSLHRIAREEYYTQNELVKHPFLKNMWVSLDHHSSYNGDNVKDVLHSINADLKDANTFLKKCNRAFITLGSAYVYDTIVVDDEHNSPIKTTKTVANCHKLPSSYFQRHLQSIDEITNHILKCISSLKSLNPKTSITLTLSPVRHWKDGPIENTLSKSHLIAGIHNALHILEQQQQQQQQNQQEQQQQQENNNGKIEVDYFPSYEIVMDELRDYRFYEEDMLHPTKVASNYIFERLLDSHFDLKNDKDQGILKKVKSIEKALKHKPFRPDSEEYIAFLKKQLEEMERLEDMYHWMDFGTEKKMVLKRLEGVGEDCGGDNECDDVISASGGYILDGENNAGVK